MPFTEADLKQISDTVVNQLKTTPTPVIPPPATGMDWTKTAGAVLTTALLGVIAARQTSAPVPSTIPTPSPVAPAPVSDVVALKLADHETRVKALEEKVFAVKK